MVVAARADVDELRVEHAGRCAQLAGLGVEYRQAARRCEADGATDPAGLAAVRSAIAARQRTVRAGLDELDDRYRALVRRVSAAADACSDRLRGTVQIVAGRGSHSSTPRWQPCWASGSSCCRWCPPRWR